MMLNAVGQIGLASPQAVRDRVGFNSGSPRSQEDTSGRAPVWSRRVRRERFECARISQPRTWRPETADFVW